jgi:endonuclease YncB( thermonuclease family)
LCCAIYVSWAVNALAAGLSGRVVRVPNGDTIEVLHSNRAERTRCIGLDCPEKGQAYGQKAKQAASSLVFGTEVTLQTFGKDKYGPTIADVVLPDGTTVKRTPVKDGWCWWYRQCAPGNTTRETLEAKARESKRGLCQIHPNRDCKRQMVMSATVQPQAKVSDFRFMSVH